MADNAEQAPDKTEVQNGPESAASQSPISTVPLGPKTEIQEFVPGKFWTKIYFVRYAGATFSAKTTIVKLNSGSLLVHSPGGPLDDDFKAGIQKIGGNVAYLVAPGDWHHLWLPDWQLAYPEAKTFICQGLDTKRKDLKFDGILKDEPEEEWKEEFLQMFIQGRMMSEVLFFHIPTSTLIVTDLVQFVTEEALKKDGTSEDWGTWFWVNVLRMKNRAVMAPEYRTMGFPDKIGVKTKMEHVINEWKPEKVIVNHGENMIQGQESIKAILQVCWSAVVGKPDSLGVISPSAANPAEGDAPQEGNMEPSAENISPATN